MFVIEKQQGIYPQHAEHFRNICKIATKNNIGNRELQLF